MNLQKYREKVGFVHFYAMLVLALGLSFWAGYELAHVQKEEIQASNSLQKRSLANLILEHEKLQSDFNMLKVELDINELANERTQAERKSSMNKKQALKEQVAFYQRVLAPEITQDGFVLERIEITPTVSKNNYAIKMMLLQHENIKAVIKGKLQVRIFGSEEGKVVSYAMSDFQDEPKTAFEFAFKYFQVIETSITLPNSFTPERLEISTDIFKYKRKRGDYNTSIKWTDAFIEADNQSQ